MKKIILNILFLVICIPFYGQREAVEPVLPESSPFHLGKDIEGSIQNSINKATGKVIFSVPISTINANTVATNISLTYNGDSALEEAKNTNEFNPTSTLGVGFSFAVPKIVVDHKDTAARDDDTFYLIDGNSTELICVAKTDEYLEFKPKKYAPWKIKYYLGNNDYWSIIKEDGVIYQYGAVPSDGVLRTNAKSYVSTWGNWIGNSNQNPTGNLVTEWYLYKIKDQWDNYIHFKYDKVIGKLNSQFPNATLNKHTEAVYIREIESSNNSKVTFTYGDKIPQEYFEPHTEQAEPDAYQEKYEKKYLQNIQTFNSNNELVFKYKFEYNLVNISDPTKPYIGKRYLTRIIQENKNGESLPPQEFEYNITGDFKGSLSKITYPTGGSVSYNYAKKTLFYNSANRFVGNQPNVSGYQLEASLNVGDYVLDLYRTVNSVSGNLYRYKIIRYHWTGENWSTNEFTFPHLLTWDYGDLHWRFDGFKMVVAPDYYGFMYHNRANKTANLYLFHLKNDGKTWTSSSLYNSSIESKNKSPYVEDPSFLNGENFVAIGTKRSGELRIYTWNGINWNYKYIEQNAGEYYYAARNNFILSLNEDGSKDLSNNIFYDDNYYIHYLDSEKKWHTKSWTQRALQSMRTVEEGSYFYPSNALSAYVADDNPEYFLRWDKNYNLTNVDNVLGGYSDQIPIYNVNGEMFAVDNTYKQGFRSPNSNLHKLARFNGIDWSRLGLNSNTRTRGYSKDLIFYQRNNTSSYSLYNPNDNNWYSGDVQYATSTTITDYSPRTTIFGKFIFIDKYLYKLNENPFSAPNLSPFTFLENMPFEVRLAVSNGYNKGYVSSAELYLAPGYSTTINTRLYYINKKTGRRSYINFDGKFGMEGLVDFGGYLQFLNGNSIYLRNIGTFNPTGPNSNVSKYLYHFIDDQIEQNVYDIVVDNIQIDNKLDPLRKIKFSFEDYSYLSDETAFYGKVTTEHKGFGNSNNGKIINFFNTGTSDLRLIGTPIKTEIRDSNNILKSEMIYDTDVFLKNYFNSSNVSVGRGYYVRTTQKTENLIQENGSLTSKEEYRYNNLGLLDTKTIVSSNGESSVTTTTLYANLLYPFLNDKNIMNQPGKLIQKRGDKIIGVSETKWKEENNRVYPYQMLAGISKTKVLTEITKVNNLGLAQEENNGKGIYSVNLFGYDNKYQVAKINNATYNQVIANLDVSYATLQTLNSASLKTELLKLYTRLPNASITLSLYDNNGNIISNIDTRKEQVNYFYDAYNRQVYTTDAQGNKLNQTEYNFKQ
ncbi:hypothetical protein [Tenacibaculum amylolyticum]|uniref:hypothetical protein n=1 Tax=Tenacibaculum amylolyticum TaxID=104269 RepID=UPI003894E8B8